MESGTFSRLELANQNTDRFGEPISDIKTASQWFLARFPDQAKIWGAPFLENRISSVDGFSISSPIAPNPSFMAAVLGHDDSIQNSVIYYGLDCQFYYFDPIDQKYHSVQDQKLGDLMRGYFQRCAMEMQKDVNVYHLFTTFCHDQIIKTIVDRAKSILLASDDYFSSTSPCSRVNGIEMHERLARMFCEGLVSSPGHVLLVGAAYERFAALVKEKELEPIKRSVFKEMMKPLMRESFNICLRNDLVVEGRYQHGWKDVALNSEVLLE
jgi:hypothetical protein